MKVTSSEECSQRDSVIVSYSVPPEVELGNDTLLCQGDELLLDAITLGAIYQWQDNSTSNSYTITNFGLYWVKVANAEGFSSSDSIAIGFSIPPW